MLLINYDHDILVLSQSKLFVQVYKSESAATLQRADSDDELMCTVWYHAKTYIYFCLSK